MKKTILLLLACALLSSCASTHKAGSATATEAGTTENRDGSSFATAIVVNSVREEYQWVNEHYPGSLFNRQLLMFKRRKPYDVLSFTLPDGQEKEFYFDISKFYGKF